MATTSTVLSSESGKVVTVTIAISPEGEVVLDHDPFVISKSNNQQVLWKANTRFNVDFVNGSPFEYTQFSDQQPYSGLVRREVLADPGKYYKYIVTIGGKKKDPGGVVDR